MRKITVLLAIAAIIATSAAPHSASAARTVKKQILIPTAATGVTGNCPGTSCQKSVVSRHHRCAYLTNSSASQDGTTGKFGYTIRLTAAEGDGLHRFKLTDATGSAPARDFDVVFYKSLGSCAGPPVGAGIQPATPPSFTKFGTDSGRIARGMRYAIVVLFAGPAGSFRFTTTP